MITQAIGASLSMSVGVALSPLPVAAVIILLMTAGARVNAPSFLLGWLLGILAVGCVVFLLPISQIAGSEPTPLAGAVRIAMGIFVLLLAAWQWQQRPAENEAVEVPKVLARLDNISGKQSLLTGFLLSGVNPKNLLLTAAGAAVIDSAIPTIGTQVVTLLVFAALASLTVIAPIAGYFLFPRKASSLLNRLKDWLISHNVAVLFVILLMIGVVLVGRGMRILVL